MQACAPLSPTFNLGRALQVAIPSTSSRRISRLGVYACTAVCSILAYLWLLFILMGNSPDVVTLPEVPMLRTRGL